MLANNHPLLHLVHRERAGSWIRVYMQRWNLRARKCMSGMRDWRIWRLMWEDKKNIILFWVQWWWSETCCYQTAGIWREMGKFQSKIRLLGWSVRWILSREDGLLITIPIGLKQLSKMLKVMKNILWRGTTLRKSSRRISKITGRNIVFLKLLITQKTMKTFTTWISLLSNSIKYPMLSPPSYPLQTPDFAKTFVSGRTMMMKLRPKKSASRQSRRPDLMRCQRREKRLIIKIYIHLYFLIKRSR